jgi:hypothetical protein
MPGDFPPGYTGVVEEWYGVAASASHEEIVAIANGTGSGIAIASDTQSPAGLTGSRGMYYRHTA